MRYDIDQIKKDAAGKWFGIISSLGIDTRQDDKHSPCPCCGGKDRFRMDKAGDGCICTNCGSSDTISLIQRALGWNLPETLKRISEMVGTIEFEPPKSVEDEAKKRTRMNDLWASGKPISGGDLAGKYLRSRGIAIFPDPSQVRFTEKCFEPETKTEMPAMLCLIKSNKDSRGIGIHRTYLSPEGGKAKIDSPRKYVGKTSNGAIRLMPVIDHMGVAEGIETALSASQLCSIPVWSCMDAGIMESFTPPEGVRKITIFGDCDANFTGQASAYRLAKSLYNKDLIVTVDIPMIQGDDWNDVLMKSIGGVK